MSVLRNQSHGIYQLREAFLFPRKSFETFVKLLEDPGDCLSSFLSSPILLSSYAAQSVVFIDIEFSPQRLLAIKLFDVFEKKGVQSELAFEI